MCQSKSRCNVVLSFLLPMKLICPALIKCVEHPPVLYFFVYDSLVTRVANILSDSSLIRTRPSQKCMTLGGLHAVGGRLTIATGDALHPSPSDGVTWARSRYFGKDRMVKYATL